MIEAYFRALRRKIEQLPGLYARSFQDEALILCNVYIDWLATGHYGGGRRRNRENFCRALKEFSGNPFFGTFHPSVLREEAQKYCRECVANIEALADTSQSEFLEESKVRAAIEASAVPDGKRGKVLADLWKASMANKTYEWCRNTLIHGPGYITVSFERTTYRGKRDIRLDFELIYGALCNIFARIERLSVQTGQWFGNPSFQNRG